MPIKLTTQWTKNNPLTIHLKPDDLTLSRQKNYEPIKVDSRGFVRFGKQIKNKEVLINHAVTIILTGLIPRGSSIYVPENTTVYETLVTTMGQMFVGSEHKGQPVTIIVHGVTQEERESMKIAETTSK
jgi:hypothetical protein